MVFRNFSSISVINILLSLTLFDTSLYKIFPEAIAEIFGKPTKVVKPGSPLRLSCILRHSIEPPMYIFWYHRDKMINYNLGTGAAIRHGRQGSELIFPRAEIHHSGNYSCVPSNARQASVLVHVTQRAGDTQFAFSFTRTPVWWIRISRRITNRPSAWWNKWWRIYLLQYLEHDPDFGSILFLLMILFSVNVIVI